VSLIVKGKSVSFDLIDGSKVDAPAAWGMIHDPTGRKWKRTSVLVMPFEKLGEETEGDSHSQDYLGRTHLTRVGDVRLPPKSFGDWKLEGEVSEIWYVRTGRKYGGKRFRHRFNAPSLARFFKGKGRVRLYSRSGSYRLELPRGASVDGRGYVWP
jgi:hypothetical protein